MGTIDCDATDEMVFHHPTDVWFCAEHSIIWLSFAGIFWESTDPNQSKTRKCFGDNGVGIQSFIYLGEF